MNIKIFKDKKPHLNKLVFFNMTPTYSFLCPKSIITHFITGNKLYEIMRNNRLGKLVWIEDGEYIFRYNIYQIPKKQNIVSRYIRKIPKRTRHLEKNKIDLLGNLKYKNKDNYITNKKLKELCKINGLHGYSNLNRKSLICLLMKL